MLSFSFLEILLLLNLILNRVFVHLSPPRSRHQDRIRCTGGLLGKMLVRKNEQGMQGEPSDCNADKAPMEKRREEGRWGGSHLDWSEVWRKFDKAQWGVLNQSHQSEGSRIFQKQEVTLIICCTLPWEIRPRWDNDGRFQSAAAGPSVNYFAYSWRSEMCIFIVARVTLLYHTDLLHAGLKSSSFMIPVGLSPWGNTQKRKVSGTNFISFFAVIDVGSGIGCLLLLHPLSIINPLL